MNLHDLAAATRAASPLLAATSTASRNQALLRIAEALAARKTDIFSANAQDLSNAEKLPAPLKRRLAFDERKLADVCEGLRSLAALPDPIGNILRKTELDEGLILTQIRCPIGVIGVIFESRPDALVQIASLCLKSGNAVLLKGGSEALHTNRLLTEIIQEATAACGIPANWIHLLETREDVREMLALKEYIDLLIPRGSNAFVQYIMDNTDIPVMGHSEGICHGYVDCDADLDMAVRLAVDAKTQGVSACNAMETLLVHQAIAGDFLPRVASALRAKNVRLLGCPATCAILPGLEPAGEEEWDREYLDYILSIRVVPDLQEAIRHINAHGSRHTEMIVTQNEQTARRFCTLVDAADVFWNASTRFADGFRFGLGAEVGISTGKIHARGPVGLEGLCSYKWLLRGNGHEVAGYCDGSRHFTHRPL